MWVRFSGIVGLVIFLFGFIAAFLVQNFTQPLLLTHMIVGLFLIAVWLFGYGIKNVSEAGEVLRGRSARFGLNATLYIAVFLGFLLVINWFVNKYDKRWDLTEEGVYSLSTQTINALNSLKKPLKIVAFKGVTQTDELALKELVDLYQYNNPTKVEVKVIDARTKPHLLDQYEMKTGNVIYLEYGEGENKGVSRVNLANEQELTNAIIKLTRGEAKKIYYVEGHDEPDITSDAAQGIKGLADAIGDEHLAVTGILLSQQPTIPEDAAAVILCSPKKALLPEEKEVLKKYVDGGGRLLMMTDPRTTNDVKELASHYGIEIGTNVVIDQIQRLFAAPALGAQPVVREYAQHAITKNMKSRDITVFNVASSVTAKNKAATTGPENWTELIKTGASAWGETDVASIFDQTDATATFEPATDVAGPVSLAVAYEKKIQPEEDKKDQPAQDVKFEKSARVVVFGDSDWIVNANLAVYANRDLVLSSINWLVGEEGGISLPKKAMRKSDAPMTQEDFMFLLAASFVVPEAILILGLFIWWRRKAIGA